MKWDNIISTVLLLLAISTADTLTFDWKEFINRGLQSDPILVEKRFQDHFKELEVDKVKWSVVLPKFEVIMGWGVTPGYTQIVEYGDTVETLDFSQFGPAFVSRIDVAQPLNLSQRTHGLRAARLNRKISKLEVEKLHQKKGIELLEYYYGFLLAKEMHAVVKEAKRNYDKALDDIEERLDEDEEGVSQFDLLEMKAGLYEVEKNYLEAKNGMYRAQLASQFALQLPPGTLFAPADSFLSPISITMPILDSLEKLLIKNHPDLHRLQFGMQARKELLHIATGRMGPEILLMGSFGWGKSWVGERLGTDPLGYHQDPVAHLTGSLGIGIRYKLNVWSNYQELRKAQAEYKALQLQDDYAQNGLVSQLRDAYGLLQMEKEKMAHAAKALRATEAWLKGAAMQYDLDKSKSDELLKAYKKNIYAKRDYAYSVFHYNVAIGKVLAAAGIRITEF